jgi:probable rRNA maturation factor
MSAIEPAPLVDIIAESPQWETTPGAEATVRRALAESAIATGADFTDRMLAVLLTDDAAIRRLNAQWCGIDKPTNVLSFPPARNADEQFGAMKSLGDIAIAFEITAREATEQGKPFDHHLAHLAVHGFLHLLGHDHDSESAATTMEQLECIILGRLGVPDPYLMHEQVAPRTLREARS